MRHKKTTLLSFLVMICIWAVPGHVFAQNIAVNPIAWDFGTVEVGNSESVTFEFLSSAPSPLSVYDIFLTDKDGITTDPKDVEGFFSITSAPMPIILVPSGDVFNVEVTFAPTHAGFQEAFLGIMSDAEPPNNDLLIPLQGNANAIPEPSTIFLFSTGILGAFIRRRRSQPRV